MTARIDPVGGERKLKRVFELADKAHEEIYASLRRHYPDATDDELFEKYV